MDSYRISYDDDRRYSDPATQSEVEEWAAAERGDPEYVEATAECLRLLRERRTPARPEARCDGAGEGDNAG